MNQIHRPLLTFHASSPFQCASVHEAVNFIMLWKFIVFAIEFCVLAAEIQNSQTKLGEKVFLPHGMLLSGEFTSFSKCVFITNSKYEAALKWIKR